LRGSKGVGVTIESYGKNVSKRFFSETTWTVETKLPRNDHWKVLYKLSVFYADRKSKMAANIFCIFPIWSCVNTMTCGGSHLGFPIGIKNRKFVEDLPMIILGQFGFTNWFFL
jgi:hypothetical protein